ncbi:prepilin-type cleavage/methylation domain-containing protein [Fischerella thermalis CCMEE 5201]|jgi:prepilin-type N-terminal cleavage/methylation domain-containing protein|nr:prepilin-type cleavage/methylation domain-containing protein [Fischerella thermalis CCMEE 5201]
MIFGKKASNRRLKVVCSCSNQDGFTIVESLVAIIVVGILLAAIAPVLSLSVATRVQSRRVELATQAARSYIDGVRTQRISAPAGSATTTTLSAFDAPTTGSSFNCTANSYCTTTSTSTTPPTNLYCVDFDSTGSCESTSITDMVVQAFRPNNNNATTGYALGVRVYRADAFKGNTTLLKNTSTTKITQNPFTGGAGQRTAPLVEMTADISDIVPKYSDLCARFPGGCN